MEIYSQNESKNELTVGRVTLLCTCTQIITEACKIFTHQLHLTVLCTFSSQQMDSLLSGHVLRVIQYLCNIILLLCGRDMLFL